MRENRDQLVQARENKLREEKDYLERVGGEITRQDNIKMRSSNILKNEFLFFNEQKMADTKLKKQHDGTVKKEEKYEHFPFVSGEMLENHRKDLNVQLRADFKNYIIAKSQGLVHNTRSPTKSQASSF
jgi:hypothetical protein